MEKIRLGLMQYVLAQLTVSVLIKKEAEYRNTSIDIKSTYLNQTSAGIKTFIDVEEVIDDNLIYCF